MAIYADKKDGKVTGRWRVELQLDGKRLRKRFDTLEEARSYEATSRRALAQGDVPAEAKPRIEKTQPLQTLADLCRGVEGKLWAGSSSERQSIQRLEGAVRIIGPSRLIESITIEDTDRLVKVLREREAAPGTINRYLSALNVALKWAMKRGHRSTPIPELSWNDEDEGRIRWITLPEEAELLRLLPTPEACAAYVSIRTGLRRGELLNLQKRDVEPNWVHLWGTGTKSGKGRSIPLTPDVYKALQEYFAAGGTTVEGLRYAWNKAKEAMGLSQDTDFVFHATRHTFATRAVQAGVHPRVLQRLMGHKHLSTTMRYMQVSDGMLSAAIEQVAGHTSLAHSPIGSLSASLTRLVDSGGLQGGENSINPPIDTARDLQKTLRNQEVELDLGSSGETRGGSSPSARTTLK